MPIFRCSSQFGPTHNVNAEYAESAGKQYAKDFVDLDDDPPSSVEVDVTDENGQTHEVQIDISPSYKFTAWIA